MSIQHPFSLQLVLPNAPTLGGVLFGPQERGIFAGIADAVMKCFTGKNGVGPAQNMSSAQRGPTSDRQLENQRMAAATMNAAMMQRQNQAA